DHPPRIVAVYVAQLVYCSSFVFRVLLKKRAAGLSSVRDATLPQTYDTLLTGAETHTIRALATSFCKSRTFDVVFGLSAAPDVKEDDNYRSTTRHMFLYIDDTALQVDMHVEMDADDAKDRAAEYVFDRLARFTHDYTTREADCIYQIGLSQSKIDSEIKKIWEARECTQRSDFMTLYTDKKPRFKRRDLCN
ncbi:hypothetical protein METBISCDRAFT_28905, partial [Metschnikowia bicuspidata]